MGNAFNAVANFGLMSQGMRQAQSEQQALDQGTEKTAQDQILTKKLQYGLDDVTRTQANAAAERAAVSGASSPDDAYSAVTRARQAAGDLSGMTDAADTQRSRALKALLGLAQDAVYGEPPAEAEKRYR